HVGSGSEGHHVDDFHVLHVGSAAHERFHQRLRLGAARLDVHPHARLHTAQRFVRRSQLLFVFNLPRHRLLLLTSCSRPDWLHVRRLPARSARNPPPHSKSRSQRTYPEAAAFPVRQTPPPDGPAKTPSSKTPTGCPW